jgi:Ca2+-binding EF-hand superfamily protein
MTSSTGCEPQSASPADVGQALRAPPQPKAGVAASQRGTGLADGVPDKEHAMQISDASSIARLIPSRIPQQPKAPTTTTSQPQGLGAGAQPANAPKAGFNVPPTAISSPQPTDLDTTLPPVGGQVAKSHSDPMKALMADWGKKDSEYDLDGDGTVGMKDMLQLLKQMAENPAQNADPVQALLNDWGKADSPHDLNADGTVDMKDMLELLKQMGANPTHEASGPLQSLINDWGKSDSPHDLNADGTVDIKDMLQLLKQMAETPAYEESNPLQDLINDWGKSDSPHDLNGDGTVDIQDMLQLLKQMAENPAQEPISPLQALLNDWGKTDSVHDLNDDGTVDIKDMLQLLANLASNPTAEPDTLHDPRHRAPDVTPGEVQSQSDRLQALLDDWGKTDSKFDLDGDGTVGMTDMLALLKQMANELAQSSPGDPGAVTPGTAGQTRLQQLMAAWGKTDSQFDLNADGKVGIRDMLMMLARMAQREPESSPSVRHEPNDRDHFNRIRNNVAMYHRAAARHHARSIMPQIASMDPGEVRESIERDSKIPTEQKRFVLGQIADWHPHGHQVSVVG